MRIWEGLGHRVAAFRSLADCGGDHGNGRNHRVDRFSAEFLQRAALLGAQGTVRPRLAYKSKKAATAIAGTSIPTINAVAIWGHSMTPSIKRIGHQEHYANVSDWST
jgi:hypothetical protein